MASIRALAMQHIGRPVVVHSHYGVHHGILHHCDGNGMYLQLMQNRTGYVSDNTEQTSAVLLDDMPAGQTIQEAWFPFFFIPWLAVAALSPWAYWW